MIVRFLTVFALYLFSALPPAAAQGPEYCTAVGAIVKDAKYKFRNVRGDVVRTGNAGTVWGCGIKVPGVIAARIVFSMGLFYEGALKQSPNPSDLKAKYEEHAKLLKACLLPQGYTITTVQAFQKELSGCPKLIFMKPMDGQSAPPPHVALEAIYSKELKSYMLALYIFEN